METVDIQMYNTTWLSLRMTSDSHRPRIATPCHGPLQPSCRDINFCWSFCRLHRFTCGWCMIWGFTVGEGPVGAGSRLQPEESQIPRQAIDQPASPPIHTTKTNLFSAGLHFPQATAKETFKLQSPLPLLPKKPPWEC